MLPFEFTVPGPPVSHQSRNKAKLEVWRRFVRAAAASRWGTRSPLPGPLKVTVSYYHEGLAVRIDNDNLVKPIQDALIGLVYEDDRLVTDTVIRKTSIDGLFRVRGYSLLLLEALAKGDEFLHIVIDEAPSHENLLK
jgi:Holliday junction resolvase RusA-like endonuclease